jgi:hypothetical protein
MSPDFFDPSPEDQVIVLVQQGAIRQAEKLIGACEHCNPEAAEMKRLWSSRVNSPSVVGLAIDAPPRTIFDNGIVFDMASLATRVLL